MAPHRALAIEQGIPFRDALTALFWPELDHERERRALRQSLQVLGR